MNGKHAQKKFGAVGVMAPTPPSLKTPGRGGGGLGGVEYKDRPPPPPVTERPPETCLTQDIGSLWVLQYRRRLVLEITSQRLLDQSQAGIYMGKTPHTPPFWPFWAYSHTLPQGVELLV